MTNLPQAAVRAPRFFYGWVVVGVCFLAQFGGTITGTYGLAALLVPMSQDTGWSQTQIIGVNLPASITSALVSPFFGRIADRYGTRAPMTFAALLGGITIISIAWVHDLWVYYLVFGLVNGVTRPMVQVIGVSQGVAHWFVKRRALAAGIVSIAIPISGFFGVPLATALVIQFGWRGTWVVLGAILLLAAARKLLTKPKPKNEKPKKERSLIAEFAFGAGLMAVNVETLALVAASVKALLSSKTGVGEEALVLLAIVLIVTVSATIPPLITFVIPKKSDQALKWLNEQTTKHQRGIASGFLIFFGAYLVYKGLSG